MKTNLQRQWVGKTVTFRTDDGKRHTGKVINATRRWEVQLTVTQPDNEPHGWGIATIEASMVNV